MHANVCVGEAHAFNECSTIQWHNAALLSIRAQIFFLNLGCSMRKTDLVTLAITGGYFL